MFITDQVKAYGLENGVIEFLQDRKIKYDTLVALSDAPEDCPWHAYGDLSADEVVEAVFAPLADRMPETIAQLAGHCVAVLCMRVEGVWYLLYVIKMWGSDYYLWIGRQPAEDPPLNPDAQGKGWQLPDALQEFYRVHHGFGESDLIYNEVFDQRLWRANCIRPAHRLELLSWQVEGEGDTSYQPGDLLFFFYDGGEDYFGMLRSGTQAVYYDRTEGFVEDSLAGDLFELMDEYFSDMFF